MGTQGTTGALYETRPSAAWLLPAVMAGAFVLSAVGGVPETDAWGTAFFLAFGVFMALIAVAVKRSWFRLWPDRMEYSSLTGKGRVMWFRDVQQAVLREGPYGGPVLTVRSTTGEKLSWDANNTKDPEKAVEKRLKAVHDAMVEFGVEVDSQNYMGTGPFRMWRV